MTRDFVIWLALDLRPFSDVDNTGFKFCLNKIFPEFKISDEFTPKKSALRDVYLALKTKVESELDGV